MVGSKVTSSCLGVLNDGNSIMVVNNTNLVLIPKKKDPGEVANYRPISLCNVVYKLVTKTTTNQMRWFFPTLYLISKVHLYLEDLS